MDYPTAARVTAYEPQSIGGFSLPEASTTLSELPNTAGVAGAYSVDIVPSVLDDRGLTVSRYDVQPDSLSVDDLTAPAASSSGQEHRPPTQPRQHRQSSLHRAPVQPVSVAQRVGARDVATAEEDGQSSARPPRQLARRTDHQAHQHSDSASAAVSAPAAASAVQGAVGEVVLTAAPSSMASTGPSAIPATSSDCESAESYTPPSSPPPPLPLEADRKKPATAASTVQPSWASSREAEEAEASDLVSTPEVSSTAEVPSTAQRHEGQPSAISHEGQPSAIRHEGQPSAIRHEGQPSANIDYSCSVGCSDEFHIRADATKQQCRRSDTIAAAVGAGINS